MKTYDKKTEASTFWNQLSQITLPFASSVLLHAEPGEVTLWSHPSALISAFWGGRDNTSVALFRLSSFWMGNWDFVSALIFPDHITREKLERILAVIQGTNQKALLMWVSTGEMSWSHCHLLVFKTNKRILLLIIKVCRGGSGSKGQRGVTLSALCSGERVQLNVLLVSQNLQSAGLGPICYIRADKNNL